MPGRLVVEADVEFVIVDGVIMEAFWNYFGDWNIEELKSVIAYEGWLEENHPDVRERIFEPGGTNMLLNEETVPEHQQYIAEFLAATAGSSSS